MKLLKNWENYWGKKETKDKVHKRTQGQNCNRERNKRCRLKLQIVVLYLTWVVELYDSSVISLDSIILCDLCLLVSISSFFVRLFRLYIIIQITYFNKVNIILTINHLIMFWVNCFSLLFLCFWNCEYLIVLSSYLIILIISILLNIYCYLFLTIATICSIHNVMKNENQNNNEKSVSKGKTINTINTIYN